VWYFHRCVCTVYLEQVHPLHYVSVLPLSPSTLLNSVQWISLYSLHRYICSILRSYSPLSIHPFLSLLPATDLPQRVPHIHSGLIIITILSLSSINEQSMPFELGLSHSAWWFPIPIPSIFLQMTKLHFSL
jgi:hypothetical protein